MTAAIEVASKAAIKIVVNAVSGGSSGGGGVTAHSALTGLTTGDDHPQYQRSESTFTTASSFTITDETTVVSTGSTVVLPDAQANSGRTILVGAGADVTVTRAGTDVFLDGVGSTTFLVRSGNGVGFTSVDAGGTWGWAIVTRQGSSYDLPAWAGQSVAAGEVLRMGASSPEWTNADPGAYDFLSGAGWTDDVPVVIPCKNTSAGTISKGQAVYVTGTVGSTSVVEVALADCDDAAKMPAIGLAESTMAVNATGYVVVTGVLSGINTSAFTINGPLYVSTTAGVLTAIKPTGTSELIQNIGRATRINANNGEVVVLGPGRTADVPNAIDAGKLTSGTLDIARIADGAVTSAKIADGTIVNADVSASAAIATSKISGLATIATSGSASDLSTGTVPTARLNTLAVGGQGAGSQINEPSTATSLLTSTVTIPACAAGDVLLIDAGINWVQNSGASRNVTFAVKIGSTTMLSTTRPLGASATTINGHLRAVIRVLSTTSQSGAMSITYAPTSAGSTGAVGAATGTATETISGGSLALDLLVTATANTTQNYTLTSLSVTKVAA